MKIHTLVMSSEEIFLKLKSYKYSVGDTNLKLMPPLISASQTPTTPLAYFVAFKCILVATLHSVIIYLVE